MTKNSGGALALLLLAACNASPDNGALSDAESRRAGEAAINGRIDCALEGAKRFDRDCTIDEMRGADDTILVVGRADKGYRRLQIATDGRGVVSADGAEPAKVTIVDDGMIEVAIGNDRYRLPANTGGGK
ncbi:hypothetical protein [Sphingopyxis panaciterrulae]|uniref:Lipoprotein n=1 Tax=Sphingopyxis panaciterrulae TaxID=462372 RepID=A0A7W9B601_9SPHN|nr:hypothetical protein [Sphingopyxis panaciterrulae]MBB5706901.1 hypothetical protein [Sphingopyxis panaciterrulae]